jgi:hypothetical protein
MTRGRLAAVREAARAAPFKDVACGSAATGGYHFALMKTRETPNGQTMLVVAVELATVPARGEAATVWSAPVSEETMRLTTVPTGIFVAAITTGTAAALLIVMAGAEKLPVGEEGTAGRA